MPIKKTGIGDRIRQVRLQKGMNQDEFAKLVGSSKSSISGYELEDVPVPADILASIVTECGCTADWLLFGTETDKPKNENERLILNKYREAEKYHEEQELMRYAAWRVEEGRAKYGAKKDPAQGKGNPARAKAG